MGWLVGLKTVAVLGFLVWLGAWRAALLLIAAYAVLGLMIWLGMWGHEMIYRRYGERAAQAAFTVVLVIGAAIALAYDTQLRPLIGLGG